MSRTIGVALLLLAVATGAHAQPQEPPPPPALPELPPHIAQQRDMFIQMGMDEEAALLFSVLGAATPQDMATLLPLFMMMGGGNMDEDAIGGLMFMKAMGGSGAAAQPVLWQEGNLVFIVENGVLYRINVETMTVEGQLAYRQQGVGALLPAILAPVFAGARDKAQQASCQSNLRQLCLGVLMYATDWDGVFPGETWAPDTLPYVRNEVVYTCPSRPHLPVGYAMNHQLLGRATATIPHLAETVILFESNLGGESPVGGPEDLPEGGVHNGGVNLGYADGHVKWYPVEEARRLLAMPVD